MTAEEIKQAFSMKEIVERYGVKVNRAFMCCCPFHGEKHPSMKIYEQSYHCFACGANGDIFTWVQSMDSCDFKEAFYALGGTYDKPTTHSQMALYHTQKGIEQRLIDEQKDKDDIIRYSKNMSRYRSNYEQAEQGSDEFWDNLDKYNMELVKYLNKREG